jgi:hypothetical protein
LLLLLEIVEIAPSDPVVLAKYEVLLTALSPLEEFNDMERSVTLLWLTLVPNTVSDMFSE